MKRLMIGALLLSFAVYGEEVFVGYRAVGEINVGADETRVQSDVVSHASEARIEKTGPGTLQLWENSIYQNNAFNLVVKGGVFELLNGGVEYTPAQPTAILGRAAFRVDANSVTPDPDDATRVSAWHDVRETKTEAPFDHMWGKPIWETGRPLSNVLPLLREGADGKKGVYFGEDGSGQAMKWCVNGNESNYNLANIRHAFIVTSVTNKMGMIIGANAGQSPHFHRAANPGGTGYFSNYANDAQAMLDGGNLYVDGEWTDINRAVVKRGRQLLEIKFCGRVASGANFFSDRMISGRQGGEDLHEVAIFTNSLTEAECKKVQDYLLAKWNLKRKPSVGIEAEDGGAFRKTINAGETENVALRGRGTLMKAGNGTIVTKALVNEPYRGDIALEGGSLLARNPGAMKVEAGDRFTSQGIEEGFAVTRSDDAGNDVAIEGTAPMTVRSVPANVKRLRVGVGGKLHLGAAALPAAATSAASATFINPGLEAYEAMQTKGVETLPKGTLWHGWIASNNDMAWTISPNRDVFFLNKAYAPGDSNWGF